LSKGGHVTTNHCASLAQASKPRLTLQSNRLHYVTAAHKPSSHWSVWAEWPRGYRGEGGSPKGAE